MRYCLANVLSAPFRDYHWDLVCSIAARFPRLIATKEQAIPTHFTLKYGFETDDLAQVEGVLERFAKTHTPMPVSIGGFDRFGEDVVFVKIALSETAKKTFDELIDTLHRFPWMQWQQHDGKNLHFHATIAEECKGQDGAVMEFVKDKEQHFKTRFDNVTIFVETGKTQHGYREWKTHKRFDFS